MAPPISDAVVVDVLRRVDRLTAPLVRRLGRPPALPQAEREQWWADRVSRVAAGVSAAPRFAGRFADLLPLQNTVGSAVQALVVVGVATEHGLTDPAARVAGVGGAARSLWRVSRLLGRVDDALDARPKGKLRHRALGQLPVVGVVGGYAAEREGLRRAAREA